MARRSDPGMPPREPRPERVAAHLVGLSAESRAAAYLVAKGYRIGGASPPLPVVACGGVFPTEYNSDTVWSYEAGAKGRFFDRSLQLAGSVYYLQWKNIQQGITVPICAITYTTNDGDAVSKGFDLQGQWNFDRHFQVELAVGYTDATFSKTALDTFGNILAEKGDALDVAPWTVTVGAQYNFDLFSRPAFIRADYEFKSKRTTPIPAEDPNTTYFDPGLVPDPQTQLVNLRAGVTLSNFDVAVFAYNVFNSHPQLDLTHEDSSTLLYEAQTFRPLTVGVAVNIKY